MKWKAKLAILKCQCQCSETKPKRTKKLESASVDTSMFAVYDANECRVLSQCS